MPKSAGHDLNFFHLFELPRIPPESNATLGIVKPIDVITAKFILPVLILMHIAYPCPPLII